jgi:hypothetical protein
MVDVAGIESGHMCVIQCQFFQGFYTSHRSRTIYQVATLMASHNTDDVTFLPFPHHNHVATLKASHNTDDVTFLPFPHHNHVATLKAKYPNPNDDGNFPWDDLKIASFGPAVHSPYLPTLGGSNDHGARNLGACTGECDAINGDNNAQCAVGLVCHQRDLYSTVPGCNGDGEEDWDYCTQPHVAHRETSCVPQPQCGSDLAGDFGAGFYLSSVSCIDQDVPHATEAALTAAGWHTGHWKTTGLLASQCNNYYGYNDGSAVGVTHYVFRGVGEATLNFGNCWTAGLARCAFSDRILHSRMPLDPMHVRLKQTCV